MSTNPIKGPIITQFLKNKNKLLIATPLKYINNNSNTNSPSIVNYTSKEWSTQYKTLSISDFKRFASSPIRLLSLYFLPKNYKITTSHHYIPYIKWQMSQNIVSSATAVLSMQSLLYAVGAGAGSIPLAATLSWILKDGIGQLGGIVFASWVSNKFDADPKKWRMVSVVTLDTGNFLEACTPMFPHLFLPLASLANILKNITFLAASASRASIHKSLCRAENLADVTGKAVSQGIACSLIGTTLGMGISVLLSKFYPLLPLPNSPKQVSVEFLSNELVEESINTVSNSGLSVGPAASSVLMVIVPMALLHWYLSYKSLNTVSIPTLNFQRTERYIISFIEHTISKNIEPLQFSPDNMINAENFVINYRSPYHNIPFVTVFSIQQAFPNSNEFLPIYDIFKNQNFVISLSELGIISLFVREGADSHDILNAYLTLTFLRKEIFENEVEFRNISLEKRTNYLNRALYFANSNSTAFIDSLKRNQWNTTHIFLEEGDRIKVDI